MGSKENPVVKNVMMQASKIGLRLLRNNRGTFYTMDKKRIVSAGLEADGASDLIGITPVKITPQMIGMTLGVFTAVEVKEPSWSKPSGKTEDDQKKFILNVNERGGIAFFCNNHEKLGVLVSYALELMIDRHLKNV